jgi:two-component system, NarL family, nitrate/nitrite response regulator NarL
VPDGHHKNQRESEGVSQPDKPTITVVVIDDHQLVSETLRTTLSSQPGLEVVGVADNGEDGVAMVAALNPHVALVDYRLPDMTGADVVKAITENSPKTRCVILTGSGQDRALLESLDAGALGFVTKHQKFGDVVAAVRAAAIGEASIPAAMLGKVLPQLRNPLASNRLTDRELAVLQLLAAGRSNAGIGTELFISVNTVRNHVANILAKLNAKTRTEAAAVAARDGLISQGENQP